MRGQRGTQTTALSGGTCVTEPTHEVPARDCGSSVPGPHGAAVGAGARSKGLCKHSRQHDVSRRRLLCVARRSRERPDASRLGHPRNGRKHHRSAAGARSACSAERRRRSAHANTTLWRRHPEMRRAENSPPGFEIPQPHESEDCDTVISLLVHATEPAYPAGSRRAPNPVQLTVTRRLCSGGVASTGPGGSA